MKYYKRIGFTNPHYPCKVGIIYPENFQQGHYRAVSEAVKAYPDHWQEVPESEYLLQEARERYPEGTEFISCTTGIQSISTGIFEYYIVTGFKSISTSGRHIWVRENGRDKWAEIISKPEIKIKENTMEKEIIGYKLVKQEYVIPARRIIRCEPACDYRGLSGVISGEKDISLLKQAGVLDLWFEPVYNDIPQVEIKGFKAQIFDDKVKFGCQKYSKEFILTLRKCIEENAFDFSFNGVSFIKEINEIAEYYERNK